MKPAFRVTVFTSLIVLLLGTLVTTFVFRYPSKQLLADENITTDALHPTTTFVNNSGATNLIQVFGRANLPYYLEDHVSTFPSPQLGIGSVVTVTRALPVTVVDGKSTTVQRTWATTVGGLFSEKNIQLGTNDTVSLSLDTALDTGLTIKITRVALTNIVETQTISFDTVNQNDPTINQGTTKVGQEGSNGTKALTYLVKREDGVEVSRKLVSTAITTAPKTKIILVGTKPYIKVPCAGYDAIVLSSAIKNNVDPNLLCKGIVVESNGHANSVSSDGYQGLFQYDPSLWVSVSAKAGYAGAIIFDATSQIKVTAWALAHGYSSRWWWAS